LISESSAMLLIAFCKQSVNTKTKFMQKRVFAMGSQ
jgi:hypothetical protein